MRARVYGLHKLTQPITPENALRGMIIQLDYRPYLALAQRVADLCEIAKNDELSGLRQAVLHVPN